MQAREGKRVRESAFACYRGLFSAGRQTVRGNPLALLNFVYFTTDFRSVLTSIRKPSNQGSIPWLLGRFVSRVVSSVEFRATPK
jgi:hypothetical protein